jgi:DNA-directed RNA polymerase subunit RPC12/RpoP
MAEIFDLAAMRGQRPPAPPDMPTLPVEGGPWMARQTKCMGCDHTWATVAPVGTKWIECPACHTKKGAYEGFVQPPHPTKVYCCIPCGASLFTAFLYTDGQVGVMCAECGNSSMAMDLFPPP